MNPLCIDEKIIGGITEMTNLNEFYMKRVENLFIFLNELIFNYRFFSAL
jgi:hypothetical protein